MQLFGIVKETIPVQPLKVDVPIVSTLFPMFSVVIFEHLSKAKLPISCTELGIVSVPVIPVQPEKAELPMVSTLFPMLSVVISEHPLKAELPIVVIFDGIFTVGKLLQF